MARSPRVFSNSKVYHIILKGIDCQTIFYDNQDRNFFLNQISETKKTFNCVVYAYCLMVNHVHMVIRCEDSYLAKTMKSLMVRYVHYFNKKYKRTGPLMQNRFKSKNVENVRYFIDVCKYVHRNPENAGIALTQNYEWSSYKEYMGKEKIIDKKALLYYLDNDIEQFARYTLKNIDRVDINEYIEFEMADRLKDEQFIEYIMKKFYIKDTSDIPIFFKNRSNEELQRIIKEISNIKGINITQVARVTRLGRRCIEKLWKK